MHPKCWTVIATQVLDMSSAEAVIAWGALQVICHAICGQGRALYYYIAFKHQMQP